MSQVFSLAYVSSTHAAIYATAKSSLPILHFVPGGEPQNSAAVPWNVSNSPRAAWIQEIHGRVAVAFRSSTHRRTRLVVLVPRMKLLQVIWVQLAPLSKISNPSMTPSLPTSPNFSYSQWLPFIKSSLKTNNSSVRTLVGSRKSPNCVVNRVIWWSLLGCSSTASVKEVCAKMTRMDIFMN